jgi:hypothetical protein
LTAVGKEGQSVLTHINVPSAQGCLAELAEERA